MIIRLYMFVLGCAALIMTGVEYLRHHPITAFMLLFMGIAILALMIWTSFPLFPPRYRSDEEKAYLHYRKMMEQAMNQWGDTPMVIHAIKPPIKTHEDLRDKDLYEFVDAWTWSQRFRCKSCKKMVDIDPEINEGFLVQVCSCRAKIS